MRRKVDVVERIRTDIVDGVFNQGERLRIDHLASRYETSHMPVREALRELAGDGLILFEPNKGAQVRKVDEKFIVDLMDLRANIEANLAGKAAQFATAEDIAELQSIQARMDACVVAKNFDEALQTNHEFHNTINKISGSSNVASLVSRNWVLLAALWRKFGYDENRFRGVTNDHNHIIAAISERDTRAAELIMSAHVHKSKLDLLRVIRQFENKPNQKAEPA